MCSRGRVPQIFPPFLELSPERGFSGMIQFRFDFLPEILDRQRRYLPWL
jgi:hypothetical protein